MTRFYLIAILALVGCENNSADDGGPRSFCAPSFSEVETQFSRDLWGVEFSCPGTPVYRDDLPPGILGRGSPLRIQIASDLASDVDIILAHEIGHALGHDHSSDPCDIMAGDGVVLDVECVRLSVPPAK